MSRSPIFIYLFLAVFSIAQFFSTNRCIFRQTSSRYSSNRQLTTQVNIELHGECTMASFTRRAFVSIGVATVLAGFNPSPANAQVSIISGKLIPAVINFAEWSWPYLKNALIGEIVGQAAHYAVEYGKEAVKVIAHVTWEGLKRIDAALKDAVNSHLLEIAFAAISAGIVITVAITGPASLVAVPFEIVAEAASLPILLMFYHDDVSNFIAGKAYQIIDVSE